MNEDRASKYQRLKRTSGIVSFAWSAILLALLLLTGASAALRDLAQSSGAGPRRQFARPSSRSSTWRCS